METEIEKTQIAEEELSYGRELHITYIKDEVGETIGEQRWKIENIGDQISHVLLETKYYSVED